MITSGITLWFYIFCLIMWRIWKNKNLFVFQRLPWSAFETVNVSYIWVRQYNNTHKDDSFKKNKRCFSISTFQIIGFIYIQMVRSSMRRDLHRPSEWVLQNQTRNWILDYNHCMIRKRLVMWCTKCRIVMDHGEWKQRLALVLSFKNSPFN